MQNVQISDRSQRLVLPCDICVCACFRGANTEFTWITIARGVTFSVVGNTNTKNTQILEMQQQKYYQQNCDIFCGEKYK